jgi:hypothetical protein
VAEPLMLARARREKDLVHGEGSDIRPFLDAVYYS